MFTAFWYNSETTYLNFNHGWTSQEWENVVHEYGTGFPDRDYPINIRFKKNADNEIGSITDRIEEFDDRIFDLQGRSVSPENLRPGIYIRAGKKVLVK